MHGCPRGSCVEPSPRPSTKPSKPSGRQLVVLQASGSQVRIGRVTARHHRGWPTLPSGWKCSERCGGRDHNGLRSSRRSFSSFSSHRLSSHRLSSSSIYLSSSHRRWRRCMRCRSRLSRLSGCSRLTACHFWPQSSRAHSVAMAAPRGVWGAAVGAAVVQAAATAALAAVAEAPVAVRMEALALPLIRSLQPTVCSIAKV